MPLSLDQLRLPTEVLEIHYVTDAPHRPPTKEEMEGDQTGLAKIVWELRYETGRDQRRLSDVTFVQCSKRSAGGRAETTTEVRAGTLSYERVICASVRVDGFEFSGRSVIERMTAEILDRIPAWMVERVQRKLNEMNSPEGDEDDPGN